MLELFEQGYDVVSPQRKPPVKRRPDSSANWSATLFYRVLSRLSDQKLTPDVGDFRLFSRRAVGAIRSLREQHRYMRGMVAWLGMKEAILPFERRARAAGHTSYPLLKMLRFAWTGISSFSASPAAVSALPPGCILQWCRIPVPSARVVPGALDDEPCPRLGLGRRPAMRFSGNDSVGTRSHWRPHCRRRMKKPNSGLSVCRGGDAQHLSAPATLIAGCHPAASLATGYRLHVRCWLFSSSSAR